MKKKTAKRSHIAVAKKDFLSDILSKKHRPFHGLALGSIMVLLHSIWGLLLFLGAALMVISAFAYLMGKSKK